MIQKILHLTFGTLAIICLYLGLYSLSTPEKVNESVCAAVMGSLYTAMFLLTAPKRA